MVRGGGGLARTAHSVVTAALALACGRSELLPGPETTDAPSGASGREPGTAGLGGAGSAGLASGGLGGGGLGGAGMGGIAGAPEPECELDGTLELEGLDR